MTDQREKDRSRENDCGPEEVMPVLQEELNHASLLGLSRTQLRYRPPEKGQVVTGTSCAQTVLECRSWSGLPAVTPTFRFCHANCIVPLKGLAVHDNPSFSWWGRSRQLDFVAILEEGDRVVELFVG